MELNLVTNALNAAVKFSLALSSSLLSELDTFHKDLN